MLSLQLVNLSDNQVKISVILNACTKRCIIIFKVFFCNCAVFTMMFLKVSDKCVENFFMSLNSTYETRVAVHVVGVPEKKNNSLMF